MYSNIGSKIKRLAQVVAIIGIVIFVITGFAMMIGMPRGSGVLPGILTIIVGGVISWIGSFFTYGFGQLIENSDRMVGNIPAGRPQPPQNRPAPMPQGRPQPQQSAPMPQGRPQPPQSAPMPQGRPQPQPQQNAPAPQPQPQQSAPMPQGVPQSQQYVPIVPSSVKQVGDNLAQEVTDAVQAATDNSEEIK